MPGEGEGGTPGLSGAAGSPLAGSPGDKGGQGGDKGAAPSHWAVGAFGEDAYEANKGLLDNFSDGPDKFLDAFRANMAAARAKTEGMVKVPGENATPEEVAEFRKALGVPAEPKDYGDDLVPEGFEDEAYVTGLLERGVGAGLTKQQAKDILAYEAERRQAAQAAADEEAKKAVETEMAKLSQAFGAEASAKIQQARDIVKGLGRDPDTVVRTADDVLAVLKLTSMAGEGGIPGQEGRIHSDPERELDALTGVLGPGQHTMQDAHARNDPAAIAYAKQLAKEIAERGGRRRG